MLEEKSLVVQLVNARLPLTLLRIGDGGEEGQIDPPTSFSPVTSTNV